MGLIPDKTEAPPSLPALRAFQEIGVGFVPDLEIGRNRCIDVREKFFIHRDQVTLL
jgi:hypothetical protein